MSKVRVIIYKSNSDEVLEDFTVEDPEVNSSKLAAAIWETLSDNPNYFLEDTPQ